MKKILIVEDSIFIAKVVKILLEKNKYQVIHTAEGSKALDIIKNENINLVILDLMMPEISGKDVLNNIRNDPQTKDIPVLILTAKTDALKWIKDLKGYDKFMTKPFDNNELLKEIKELLKE